MKDDILEIITEWMMQQEDSVTGDHIAHKQLASELEPLINQEVEKRIAERMPTDIDIYDILNDKIELSLTHNYKGVYIDGFEKAAILILNRMEGREK